MQEKDRSKLKMIKSAVVDSEVEYDGKGKISN